MRRGEFWFTWWLAALGALLTWAAIPVAWMEAGHSTTARVAVTLLCIPIGLYLIANVLEAWRRKSWSF